jgi:hypothetical protein
MRIPTVHLNGTSGAELLVQLQYATEALRAAEHALERAAPNGRDYYVQDEGAFEQARREHGSRVLRLAEVREELEQIAQAVYEQGLRP